MRIKKWENIPFIKHVKVILYFKSLTNNYAIKGWIKIMKWDIIENSLLYIIIDIFRYNLFYKDILYDFSKM